MSYEIIYDHISIEVSEGLFMTMILAGSNNVYEHHNGRERRARSWSVTKIDNGLPWDSIDGWNERLDTYIDSLKGYAASTTDSIRGGRPVTFRMLRNMFVSSNKAFTIEQLVDFGAGLNIYASLYSCREKGLEQQKYTLKKGDDFIAAYKKMEKHYQHNNVPIYIGLEGRDDLGRCLRRIYYPLHKRYEEYQQDHYYTVRVNGRYFAKLTKYGYRYSYHCPQYKAPNIKTVNAKVSALTKRLTDAKIEIEKVNSPAWFKRLAS